VCPHGSGKVVINICDLRRWCDTPLKCWVGMAPVMIMKVPTPVDRHEEPCLLRQHRRSTLSLTTSSMLLTTNESGMAY
jgi:hypothetical protein